MPRVLALLLALVAVLPGQAWAQLVERCAETDACCCRRDEPSVPPPAIVERVDCCETPCTAEVTPAAAEPTRSEDLRCVASERSLPLLSVSAPATSAAVTPQRRTRGPPRSVFAIVMHRLL